MSNANMITEPEKTQEDIKRNFNNIFDNQFHLEQYDITNITKYIK